MTTATPRVSARKYRAFTRKDLSQLRELRRLGPAELRRIEALSWVFPFRVNNYVLDELIDWESPREDPIFHLTFPQAEMLDADDLDRMERLIANGASAERLRSAALTIQRRLDPHPAGQMELNVPQVGGRALPGMQHKYRETVLFFPSQGQTCHAYCTYCFRWAQFIGIDELKFASREAQSLARYIREHVEVQDVLFTGGDPLIMKTAVLRRYIEPLLKIEHLGSIRVGTKATAYWPHRFLTDPDADDLIRLFAEVRKAGKHLALMSHYCHPRELSTPAAQVALRRVVSTGAVVRCQAPLVRNVNDSPRDWAELWRTEVQLGAIPYYLFIERDTGPKGYFEVPLARALDIYQRALARVSGLGRTVRGPSMSATPGKVVIDGTVETAGQRLFVLHFLQAREPSWVGRPFFARFDEKATWLSDLRPPRGERRFFFEAEMRRIQESGVSPAWGTSAPSAAVHPTLFGHVEWE